MRDLLTAAIKKGKEIKLFFIDGTELDNISAIGDYKIFGNEHIISVTLRDNSSENFIINLTLVKYFTAS